MDTLIAMSKDMGIEIETRSVPQAATDLSITKILQRQGIMDWFGEHNQYRQFEVDDDIWVDAQCMDWWDIKISFTPYAPSPRHAEWWDARQPEAITVFGSHFPVTFHFPDKYKDMAMLFKLTWA